MKVEDLRIGNLVNIQEPAVHWNGENFKDSVFEIESISRTKIFFKGFSSYEEIGSLKGIELTEEWLLKFGYEKGKIYYTEKTFGVISFYKNDDDELMCEVYDFTYRDIKYLHQLQNLYYFLHGEELKIKLD